MNEDREFSKYVISLITQPKFSGLTLSSNPFLLYLWVVEVREEEGKTSREEKKKQVND